MRRATGKVARGKPRNARLPPRGRRRGFTLVEVAVATAIVGLGIAALMVAMAAGTRVNDSGQKLTKAAFLAQEIREWTLKLPYLDPETPSAPPGSDEGNPYVFVDDLDDLSGVTFSPPRDALGYPISDLTGWSQKLTISYRAPDDLKTTVGSRTDVAYVQVEVSCKDKPLLTTGWLVARR